MRNIFFILFFVLIFGFLIDAKIWERKNDPDILQQCTFTQNETLPGPIPHVSPPFNPGNDFPNDTCTAFSSWACCTSFQANQVELNLLILAGSFGACPSCLANLESLWCGFTCTPYQKELVIIDKFDPDPPHVISQSTYIIDPEFAQGLYDSCKDIQLSGGGTVGDNYKTPYDFLSYMGAANPVETIKIKLLPGGFNTPAIPCNMLCPCSSCQDACPPIPHIPHLEKVECKIFDVLCVTFGLSIGYGVILLAGLSAILISYFFFSRRESLIGQESSEFYQNIQQNERFNEYQDDDTLIKRYWKFHGRFIARHPYLVIFVCLIFTAICGIGIKNIQIEQQPEKLWTPPGSRSEKDKQYFDERFGPFFRIEQIIFTSKNEGEQMLKLPILLEVLDIQNELMNKVVISKGKNHTVNEVCFKPIIGKGCLIESVTEYWQSNADKIKNSSIADHVKECISDTLENGCLTSIGTPIDPNVVFGGFDQNAEDYLNSTALVFTLLVNDYPETREIAEQWEKEFIKIAGKEYQHVNLAYSAQRSVQDELARESATDIPTVIISYAVMFLYVSLSLGEIFPFRGFSSLLVKTKFFLGLGGVLIVIFSLVISVGLCSWGGIKATLIISEVIPFLVLAIGVDNIFILVNTYEQLGPSYNTETRMAETLARVGSSISLASLSESLAFLLGALTRMPAVKAFSIYASLAILFDFLLQITCFSCLMVLDGERTKANRVDCFPCIKTAKPPPISPDSTPLIPGEIHREKDGFLKKLTRQFYAPFVFSPIVQAFSLFFFIALFFVGINFSTQLKLGLDQRVALPKDSYVVNYFNQLDKYLAVGPPLYIVIKDGYDYTSVSEQNKICSIRGCDFGSLISLFANAPYIVKEAPASWLDDYLTYAQEPNCCLERNGTQCLNYDNITGCESCFHLEGPTKRPPPDEFEKYLPWFLKQPLINATKCSKQGQSYITDLNFKPQSRVVKSSRFRTSHTVLKTQEDYINALRTAYYLADNSTLPVFPYSVFYIFFEQYLYIENVAIMTVGLALAGVFLVTLFLLRNPWLSVLILLMVTMIQVDLIGIMRLWDINLNAVSVVNMVMAIGISVEFCVHIAYAFNATPGTKKQRAFSALVEMGTSVFSGITLTKFFGVVVLGFSSSQIFEIYYFRMYISIVILGALHGLLFFPIVLSHIGTPYRGLWPFSCSKQEYRY